MHGETAQSINGLVLIVDWGGSAFIIAVNDGDGCHLPKTG